MPYGPRVEGSTLQDYGGYSLTREHHHGVALGKTAVVGGPEGLPQALAGPRETGFAWPGRKVAIFVDGCFWHGCRCKYLPRTNTDFWRKKIETNKRRDRRISQALRRDGWKVIRIKECAVRKASTLARIAKAVVG